MRNCATPSPRWRPHVARFPDLFRNGHSGRLLAVRARRAGLRGAGSRPWRAPGCGQPDRRRPGADHQHRPGPCGLAGRYPRKRGFRESRYPARRQTGPVRRSRSPAAIAGAGGCAGGTALPARSRLRPGARRSWLALARAGRGRPGAGAARSAVARVAHGKRRAGPAGLRVARVALAGGAPGRGAAADPGDRSPRSPRPVLERPATPAPAGRRAQSPGRPVPGATPACRSATRTLPGGLRPAGGQRPGWRTGTLDRLGAGLGRCTVADPAFAAGRGAGGGADPAPGSGEQSCGYRRRPGRAVRQGYRG